MPAHGSEKTSERFADEPLITPVIVPFGVVAVKLQADCATVTGWLVYEPPQELEPAAWYEPATLVQEPGSEGVTRRIRRTLVRILPNVSSACARAALLRRLRAVGVRERPSGEPACDGGDQPALPG